VSVDFAGLRRAQAVWDFTTGDERRFCDRLALVIDAAEQFRRHGVQADFVLLLHGPATQFGARSLAGTKFAERGAQDLAAAHALLQKFAGMGGRIEICGIAMERSAIGPDNVIAGAVIERNVFANSIALQNRGYAYVPIA
jgi:intracellular sulfur oxidation DsrE/DsrF family protein